MNINSQLLESLNGLREALSKIQGGLAGLFHGSIAGLGNKLKSSGVMAGAKASLSEVLSGLAHSLERLKATAQNFSQSLAGSLGGLTVKLADSLKSLATSWTGATSKIRSGFTTAISGLSKGLGSAFSSWLTSVKNNTAHLGDLVKASFSMLGSGWKVALGNLQASFATATGSLAKGFEKAFDATIGRLISGTGTGLKATLGGLKALLGDPKKFVASLGSSLANFGRGLFGKGGYSIGRAGRFGDSLRKGITGAVRGVRSLARSGFKGALKAAGSAMRGIKGLAKRGWQGIKGLGSVLNAGGSMAITAGIELGKMLYSLASATAQVINGMKSFAEETNQGNRVLGRYNTAISYAFQSMDRDQYFREIKLGKSVETTATMLTRSVGMMRTSFEGFDTLMQNTKNQIGGFAAAFTEGFMNRYLPAFEHLNKEMKAFDPTGTFGPALGAGLSATFDQLGLELVNGIMAIVGQNFMPLGGVMDRVNKAAQDAANAKAAALQAQNDFGDIWARGMHAIVKGGPIRGRREMPKP